MNSKKKVKKYTLKESLITATVWTILMTWVTFFSRFYDGYEYILACVITWVCGIVIAILLSAEVE